MLVELRPDLDWDKGTTWPGFVTVSTRPVTCCRSTSATTSPTKTPSTRFKFDGIGIVVGHDEDGDRKTAAHFALQSPDQVREFIQRGSQWLAYKHQVVWRGVGVHL